MTDDEQRLKHIEDSLRRIEQGLFGDESLGQFGLVSRMNNHAQRIKRMENWLLGLTAAGSTIGLVYKLAVDWLKR